jgi:hypothetical protein
MDELIGAAMEALTVAAKRKRENDPAARERYERMLEALQQRRAAQMPAPPPAPGPAAAPVAPPAPPPRAATPPPAPARPPKQTAHDREEAARAAAARAKGGSIVGLFEDGNSLLRAVVASEVLSPPLALRENPNWLKRRPPNEPST